MQRRKHLRLAAALTAAVLVVAACSDDDKGTSTTTTAAPSSTSAAPDSTAPSTDAPPSSGAPESSAPSTDAPSAAWQVDTDECVDPSAANAPIEGTVRIGSIMPLSNSIAAAAFSPVKDGFDAYVAYANEHNLLDGYTLQLTVEDDEYNKDLTPGAATKLIDAGTDLFVGVIGTPNVLAVRDTLNNECYPQLMVLTGAPDWGDADDYPWTTGGLIPYDVESKAYAKAIGTDYPDGSTVALFTAASEFGQVYADTFKALADSEKMNIVEDQTIEITDTNPPKSQVTAIAAKKPDVIMAVPVGAGCVTFLKELDAAKATTPGWEPDVYITNTCASPLILGAAGEAANGIITSNYLKDPLDAQYANDEGVTTYVDQMDAMGSKDKVTTGLVGWNLGEVTVHILRQAAASPDGLTRASIMNAARNFAFSPSMVLDGVVLKMDGDVDTYQIESVQLERYDVAKATFDLIGDLDTSFES